MVVHTVIVNWRLRSYSDLRSSRPMKTTVRDDRLTKRTVVRSPVSSTKKVQSAFLSNWVEVSGMTVSRRLTHDFGLKSRNSAKNPLLT